MSPEELWATKYAPLFEQARRNEEARREEAFLEVPLTVCGESVRQMTARDLLILNGIESPFVCGGEVDPLDIVIFLWFLNAKNDQSDSWLNNRRKKMMMRRVAGLPFEATVSECRKYVSDCFQDAPDGGSSSDSKRPIGSAIIVPLIIRIAKETGWDKDQIIKTPLAQLFQFLKHIRADALGDSFCESVPSDAITGQFLAELNAR
jgi:hypothetical protein